MLLNFSVKLRAIRQIRVQKFVKIELKFLFHKETNMQTIIFTHTIWQTGDPMLPA